MDDARIAEIRSLHYGTPPERGNPEYCQQDGQRMPCDMLGVIAALEASRAECARLRAQLDDAMETLKPFARVSELGWSAYSDRLQVVILSEGDICQAWQMIHVGSRWRPVALNGAADTTVGEP